VALTVRIVLGLESLLAVWLIALLALAAWFFAIRMLLLDSRLKKFWIVWLAGGFLLMLVGLGDEAIWLAAFGTSFVFLLFRKYKPYLHLTSRRRAGLFLLGLILFVGLVIFPISKGIELQVGEEVHVTEEVGQQDTSFIYNLGWKTGR